MSQKIHKIADISHARARGLTKRIIIALVAGLLIGLIMNVLPIPESIFGLLVDDILKLGGSIFIVLMKMLVVPVVFVSLVCGVASLGNISELGRIGLKTLVMYVLTTALAITLALTVANLLGVGDGFQLTSVHSTIDVSSAPSLKQVFLDMFPSNPFKALADGKMLQVIIFSVLFGMAITMAGKAGQRIINLFTDMNDIVMKLILMVMEVAPYGVFCLVSSLFARMGFDAIGELTEYFLVVLLVLFIQLFGVYSLFLNLLTRLNPITFFKKMYSAMLFAFSISSSNASIPVVLDTVERKLGVRNAVASFVIPLGATINMDGTAIMQGVATAFIAHAYGIDIGMVGYITVILMATLASVGTAGVPSVGLITLAMVLQQVGLPVEGIGLIIGVDRLLDMVRTAVNVTGDSMVACVVGKSEKQLDEKVFNDINNGVLENAKRPAKPAS